jgi:SAM-dependent methyltransferase
MTMPAPITSTPVDASSPTQIVASGYDQIADRYLEWSLKHNSPRIHYLDAALALVPANAAAATILELGCGAGTPVLEHLLQHPRATHVLANDISAKQLALARARCPGVTFLPGDMATLDVALQSLDLVVAFYTLFHLPRQQQAEMLARVAAWLAPAGVLVLSLATVDEPVIRGDFFGADMFWSSYGADANRAVVERAGFDVLRADLLGSGDNLSPGDPDYGLQFLWIVARKRADA